MNTNVEKTNELVNAMLRVQSEIKNPVQNKVNPYFKSKYADLPSILDYVKPILTKHNLVLIQTHDICENGIKIITKVLHTTGESFNSTLQFPVEKQTPQGYGSAITYARRYAILSLLAISADEDDDGNEHEPQHSAKQEDLTLDDRINKGYKYLNLTIDEIQKFEARFTKEKLLIILQDIGKFKVKSNGSWTKEFRDEVINGYIGGNDDIQD